MGLLSGLFRARDAPTNRTSGSAYSFFMGGSTSGKRVNERSSMQMTAVYSCVRILSEAVAGLPLHFYKYTEDGGKEKAAEHPLYLDLCQYFGQKKSKDYAAFLSSSSSFCCGVK